MSISPLGRLTVAMIFGKQGVAITPSTGRPRIAPQAPCREARS